MCTFRLWTTAKNNDTMANSNLREAKAAKNDEFYTQFHDIEVEINAYLEYDPDVFRGRTVLLPCDDPEWSNFTRYFAAKFDELGLRKLVSTSYAPESKKYGKPYQPSLFEQDAPQFDPQKSTVRGKIFVLEQDRSGDGRINIDDLQWEYLDGDGDFRSREVTALRDEADFIITNPPFSLFREFLAWIMEGGKRFVIIGNKNCITYKEVFPLIKANKIWIGRTPMSVDLLFETPDTDLLLASKKSGSGYRMVEGKALARSQSVWLTNVDHGRRHQPLELMTMADNLRYSRHKELRGKSAYAHYDNYDAIEVPFTDAIPSDYDGVMGVPISFLDKYCPEQFEILGATESEGKGFSNGLFNGKSAEKQPVITPPPRSIPVSRVEDFTNVSLSSIRIPGYDKYDRPYVNGKRLYFRLFIRKV